MTITEEQIEQLAKVKPSNDNGTLYYPCEVELNDGSVYENAYLVDYDRFIKTWGPFAADDKAKSFIPIENVVRIKDSPNRLPADLANKLYNAGESGMGYCLFKIMYDTGIIADVCTGNAVDFVPLPKGLTTINIVDVFPNQGSRDNFDSGPKYVWCLINQ